MDHSIFIAIPFYIPSDAKRSLLSNPNLFSYIRTVLARGQPKHPARQDCTIPWLTSRSRTSVRVQPNARPLHQYCTRTKDPYVLVPMLVLAQGRTAKDTKIRSHTAVHTYVPLWTIM